MSTVVPVYQYTCSVCLFLFGITSTITFQLIYWGMYTQIYLKINLPVYLHAFLLFNHKDLPQIYPKINLPVSLHASLLFNHKDLPVITTTCVHAHIATRSLPYLFILIISFQQTISTNLSSQLF